MYLTKEDQAIIDKLAAKNMYVYRVVSTNQTYVSAFGSDLSPC